MTPPPSFPKYWLIYPERKRLSLQQQAHSMLTFSLIFLKQNFTSLIWKHTSRLLLPPDCHANVILLKQLFWKCHTQKSDCGLWKLLTNFHSHHQQLSSELKVSTVNSRMIRSVSLVQENQLVELKRMCSRLWLLPVFVTGSSGKATAKSEPLTCFCFWSFHMATCSLMCQRNRNECLNADQFFQAWSSFLVRVCEVVFLCLCVHAAHFYPALSFRQRKNYEVAKTG